VLAALESVDALEMADPVEKVDALEAAGGLAIADVVETVDGLDAANVLWVLTIADELELAMVLARMAWTELLELGATVLEVDDKIIELVEVELG